MIPYIIIYTLTSIVNIIFIYPAIYLGNLFAAGWSNTFEAGFIFLLRPLMYFQAFIDVRTFYKAISWNFDVLISWLYFIIVNWIVGIIRGHSTDLKQRSDSATQSIRMTQNDNGYYTGHIYDQS